jgi:hypothetical protein
MAVLPKSFKVPYRDSIVERGGFLSSIWARFFRELWERLYPLGIERSFELANAQTSAADITDMKFNKRGVTAVLVHYLVMRITTGTGATELVETGLFMLVYKPTSDSWVKVSIDENNPIDAGVTFSVTSEGQGQYQTTNMSGDASISRLYWRAQTLGGKNYQYSQAGAA